MHAFAFYLALVSLCLLTIQFLELAVGSRRLRFLGDVTVPAGTAWPKVAVIIPARNEARNIEEALASVLALDYAPLEIRVINDRSTDATGAILAHMAARHPPLKVSTISHLPTGWLGKNHALDCGARAAGDADWLLFTDADIVMQPDTLKKAVAYCQQQHLDHLTVAPELRMQGVWLQLFASAFALFFTLFSKPWQAPNAQSRAHIGIGAFNLVRRAAYFAAGGHAAIALRPDDDMKLGKLMKKHGFRQDFLIGRNRLHVEWYSSPREVIDGLMKNAFAGVDYRIRAVLGASLYLFFLWIWPFAAICLTHGTAQLLNGVMVLEILGIGMATAWFAGNRLWTGLGLPAATLLLIYILMRSMVITLTRGGITWRGTFYPLAALKKNKI